MNSKGCNDDEKWIRLGSWQRVTSSSTDHHPLAQIMISCFPIKICLLLLFCIIRVWRSGCESVIADCQTRWYLFYIIIFSLLLLCWLLLLLCLRDLEETWWWGHLVLSLFSRWLRLLHCVNVLTNNMDIKRVLDDVCSLWSTSCVVSKVVTQKARLIHILWENEKRMLRKNKCRKKKNEKRSRSVGGIDV